MGWILRDSNGMYRGAGQASGKRVKNAFESELQHLSGYKKRNGPLYSCMCNRLNIIRNNRLKTKDRGNRVYENRATLMIHFSA